MLGDSGKMIENPTRSRNNVRKMVPIDVRRRPAAAAGPAAAGSLGEVVLIPVLLEKGQGS
jgi:hypothetical protein